MEKVETMNALILAFVGDGVYTDKIRTYLANNFEGKVNDLHKMTNSFVCAEFQVKVYNDMQKTFSSIEENIANRARNIKKNNTPKHASLSDYNKSTSLEAVIGYNHLISNFTRVDEFVTKSIEIKNCENLLEKVKK